MKYKEKFTQQIFRWVEQHGVYPQKMGESITNLCLQFGIDSQTYANWLRFSEFSEGIKKANEVFRVNTCNDIVNSLVKRAKGYKDIQVVIIGKPDENGEMKSQKIQRTEKDVPPDVAAQIFLLTNLDSEHWVNPMKIEAKADLTSGGRPLSISVVSQEAADNLERLGDE